MAVGPRTAPGGRTTTERGKLRALVATASLELGIDIGEMDLVCRLGSTRSITLSEACRAIRSLGDGNSKGRMFPGSRRTRRIGRDAGRHRPWRAGPSGDSTPAAGYLAQQIVAAVGWRSGAKIPCTRWFAGPIPIETFPARLSTVSSACCLMDFLPHGKACCVSAS